METLDLETDFDRDRTFERCSVPASSFSLNLTKKASKKKIQETIVQMVQTAPD